MQAGRVSGQAGVEQVNHCAWLPQRAVHRCEVGFDAGRLEVSHLSEGCRCAGSPEEAHSPGRRDVPLRPAIPGRAQSLLAEREEGGLAYATGDQQ